MPKRQDFLPGLGYLSLAVRLKRISDNMIHSCRELYQHLGWDIEPNWYLIFKLLKEEKCLSITEIAASLQFSHPSVVSMVHKIKERGYLESCKDPKDSRRQLVSLSMTAIKALPEWERIWSHGTRGVEKIFLENSKILEEITRLETAYTDMNFKERTLNELEHEK